MNQYRLIAKAYDLLDVVYFREKGKNPRQVIQTMIPHRDITILNLCCGTLSNSIALAKCRPDSQIVGLDLSRDMLREAKMKLDRQQIKNVHLNCGNAAKTGMRKQSFDVIIIGFVLHESSPELIKGILSEAYRLLKDQGNLIVLEWERPKKLFQLVKFFPLYLMERLSCQTFQDFFTADKELFFRNYGFIVEQNVSCNYSMLLTMKKDKRSASGT